VSVSFSKGGADKSCMAVFVSSCLYKGVRGNRQRRGGVFQRTHNNLLYFKLVGSAISVRMERLHNGVETI
jgi:hypothetical protein